MSATIPSVDLGPFLVNEGVIIGEAPTEAQAQVARLIDAGCRDHGFLHVHNFGVSCELYHKALKASKALFALPTEHKMSTFSRIRPETNQGYSPLQTESVNSSRPPELKEAFNVRFPPNHTNDLTGCPEEFKAVVEELIDTMQGVTRRYHTACALALQLPDHDFFSRHFGVMDLSTIRFLHYPPCDFDPDSVAVDHPIRIGEHTDFGTITFLFIGEHGPEGLQIKPVQGGEVGGQAGGEGEGWLNVELPRRPNDGDSGGCSAVVNTGALMARWTNDQWRATAHRVIVSDEAMASRHRYSIACFCDPDAESLVEVHDQFAVGKEKKYKPITSSDYLVEKLQSMMKPKN